VSFVQCRLIHRLFSVQMISEVYETVPFQLLGVNNVPVCISYVAWWWLPTKVETCCSKSYVLLFVLSQCRSCMSHLPIPGAARSKAWVCGRSLTGVAGSNTAGDIRYLFVVSVVCCQSSLCWADHLSIGVWCVWVWSWSLDNE